jgi:hypothetical protein
MDLLYKNEIFPHSKNLKRAERLYAKWKRRRQVDIEFHKRLASTDGNLFKIFLARIWYHSKYPTESVRSLLASPLKIKRMFQKV